MNIESESKNLCSSLVKAAKDGHWDEVRRVDDRIRSFVRGLSPCEKSSRPIEVLAQTHNRTMAFIQEQCGSMDRKINVIKKNSEGLKAYEQTSSIL